jgi:hypothetical protein
VQQQTINKQKREKKCVTYPQEDFLLTIHHRASRQLEQKIKSILGTLNFSQCMKKQNECTYMIIIFFFLIKIIIA